MKPAFDTPPTMPPILVDARTASAMLSIGLTMFYELDSKGALPQSIQLNSKRCWSVELLQLWVRFGCPRRDDPRWAAVLAKLREAAHA